MQQLRRKPRLLLIWIIHSRWRHGQPARAAGPPAGKMAGGMVRFARASASTPSHPFRPASRRTALAGSLCHPTAARAPFGRSSLLPLSACDSGDKLSSPAVPVLRGGPHPSIDGADCPRATTTGAILTFDTRVTAATGCWHPNGAGCDAFPLRAAGCRRQARTVFSTRIPAHSTVTLLARLRGLSTSQPRATAM